MGNLDFAWVLSGLLMIPYLVWGVYTLRLRLVQGVEFPPLVEAATLVGVFVFYLFQFYLLKLWLGQAPLNLFLSLAGLLMSGLALYGPMLLSLGSQAVVDAVVPASREIHTPQYGAAEALERQGDFQGAALAYEAVARMFPKDPTAAVRAADNHYKAEQFEDAAAWFEQALNCFDSPEQRLVVVYRLVAVYDRNLNRPQAAREVLEDYLTLHGDSEYAHGVRTRLQQLASR